MYFTVGRTRGSHQAAPRVSEQLAPLVAEGGGEDGEVGVRQLLEVGPAAGLRHQGVAEESHGETGHSPKTGKTITFKKTPRFWFSELTRSTASRRGGRRRRRWRSRLPWCGCTCRSTGGDTSRCSLWILHPAAILFHFEHLGTPSSHLSLLQVDLVVARPPTGFDELLDLLRLHGPHPGAREPLQHRGRQTTHTHTHCMLHTCSETFSLFVFRAPGLTCLDLPARRSQTPRPSRQRTTWPKTINTHTWDIYMIFRGQFFAPADWNPGAFKNKLGALFETWEITFNLQK